MPDTPKPLRHLVIFGATGDLSGRMLLPSLYFLDADNLLAADVKIIPDEIAAMMDEGETFTPDVRRKLTERLNVELAELKNLRGLAGEDLKREAEIEKLLGLFARLGEI